MTSSKNGIEDPKRHRGQHQRQRGQVFTPAMVCDLMTALAVTDQTQSVLEPGCGEGIFLCRLMDYMQEGHADGLAWQEVLARLWAVDIDPVMVTKTRQTLCQIIGAQDEGISFEHVAQQVSEKVSCRNFLALTPQATGGPEVILGNPPYVRGELLKQTCFEENRAYYQQILQDFETYLLQYPQQRRLFSPANDLFVWYILQSTRLMATGGTVCFVVSNSWLETDIGRLLQVFLSHWYDEVMLVESTAECWFATAAIRPVILWMKRHPPNGEGSPWPRDGALYHVRLSRPLEELVQHLANDKASSGSRQGHWPAMLRLAAMCQNTAQQDVLGQEVPGVMRQHFSLSMGEEPAEGLPGLGAFGSGWQILLRTSAEVTHYLRDAREAFCRLDEVCRVRYPLKSGHNSFFYLTREAAEHHGIHPRWLRPLLKTTRAVETLRVDSGAEEMVMFDCDASKDSLNASGDRGTLAYIEWGEAQVATPRQKRLQPMPLPQLASFRGRKQWYALKSLPPADMVVPRFIDQRYFVAQLDGTLMEDQTFYGLLVHQRPWAKPLHLFCNSMWAYYWLEVVGRNNLGDGVLQLSRADCARLPVIHPARLLAHPLYGQLAEVFEGMAERPVLPFVQERVAPDRVRFESIMARVLASLTDVALGFQTHLFQTYLLDEIFRLQHQRRDLSVQRKRLERGRIFSNGEE